MAVLSADTQKRKFRDTREDLFAHQWLLHHKLPIPFSGIILILDHAVRNAYNSNIVQECCIIDLFAVFFALSRKNSDSPRIFSDTQRIAFRKIVLLFDSRNKCQSHLVKHPLHAFLFAFHILHLYFMSVFDSIIDVQIGEYVQRDRNGGHGHIDDGYAIGKDLDDAADNRYNNVKHQ